MSTVDEKIVELDAEVKFWQCKYKNLWNAISRHDAKWLIDFQRTETDQMIKDAQDNNRES